MRVLILVLLAPVALAATTEEYRYVVGTGGENAELFCFHLEAQTPALAPPSIGGACTILIAPGMPLAIEAIDDDSGHVRFFYDLRSDASGLPCASGFVASPYALSVPAGCDQITVAPEVASLAGVVRLTG